VVGRRAQASPSLTPLRVLLVCDWFLKYVGPFAEALVARGAHVGLLCRAHAHEFAGDADERGRILAAAATAGVEVMEVPGRAASLVGAARPVAAALRFDADVVHAQSEIHDPRLLVAVGRKPLVLMVHDPRPHLGAAARPLRLRLWRELWERRADCLLVHSEALSAALPPGKPVRVLAHGAVVRAAPFPAPERGVVLLFGRLEYYKGVRVLLRAMETVWAERPQTTLLVAGRGPELVQIPHDPRIETLSGYVPEAEIDALMSRASLVVLPYLEASQSGVGAEAIARGVPIVATQVGGLADLALDASYVVPPGDAPALALALLRHLDDADDVRTRVLEHARREVGWDGVAERALGLYRELSGRRR
jgi:glycosyltransferase involved in cell wall biosynthesis